MIPDARPRIAAIEKAIRPYVRLTPVVALAGEELGLPGRFVTLA